MIRVWVLFSPVFHHFVPYSIRLYFFLLNLRNPSPNLSYFRTWDLGVAPMGRHRTRRDRYERFAFTAHWGAWDTHDFIGHLYFGKALKFRVREDINVNFFCSLNNYDTHGWSHSFHFLSSKSLYGSVLKMMEINFKIGLCIKLKRYSRVHLYKIFLNNMPTAYIE